MNQFNCYRVCFSSPKTKVLSSLFEENVEKFEAVSGIDVKIKTWRFHTILIWRSNLLQTFVVSTKSSRSHQISSQKNEAIQLQPMSNEVLLENMFDSALICTWISKTARHFSNRNVSSQKMLKMFIQTLNVSRTNRRKLHRNEITGTIWLDNLEAQLIIILNNQ